MSFQLFSARTKPCQRQAETVTASWKPPECLREFDLVTDKEIVQELIHSFVSDAAERLRSMRSVMLTGDGAQLARLAHSLKGSAAQMGAEQMAELCRQLEHAAGSANAEGLSKLEQLETYFRSTSCAMLGYAAGNLPSDARPELDRNASPVVAAAGHQPVTRH